MEECIKECSFLKDTIFPYLIKDKISKESWSDLFPNKNYDTEISSDIIYTDETLNKLKDFFIIFNNLSLDNIFEESLKKIELNNKIIIVWDPTSLLWKIKNIEESCTFLKKNIINDLTKLELEYKNIEKYCCNEKGIELKFLQLREEIEKSDKKIKKEILNYINRTDKEKEIMFNNHYEHLIAFGDKYVLDLKTKEIRIREYNNYFINAIEYRKIKEIENNKCFPITDWFEPKDIGKIQLLLGSLLSGKNDQVFYIFQGEGANGKSTFLNILEILMGNYFTYVSNELFTKNNTTKLEESYKLNNKRIAVFDGKELFNFNESKLINLVEKYKNCKFIFSLNNLPKLSSDFSTKRRTIHIPFIYKFKGCVVYGTDKEVIHPLIIDYDYVFSWLLEGCSRYLNSNQVITKLVCDYIEGSSIFEFDSFKDFVKNKVMVTKNKNDSETFRNFYMEYFNYMEQKLKEGEEQNDYITIEQYKKPLKEKEFLKIAKDSFINKRTTVGNKFFYIKIKYDELICDEAIEDVLERQNKLLFG